MHAVREPAVAGQFYPESPVRLRAEVESLLARETLGSAPSARIRAMIVPHAGYTYSGATTARTMVLARQGRYRRALIMAPAHRLALDGLAVTNAAAYRTPLGDAFLDQEAQDGLLARGDAGLRLLPRAHLGEHALEVQLPFLQVLFPELPIVPLICGRLDDAALASLARSLATLWTPETLWVISSDFTHYGASFGYLPFTDDVCGNLERLDRGAIDRILALDGPGFSRQVAKTGATICGREPIRLLLAVAAAAPVPPATRLVDYITSGHLTGDWHHCVSYAGLVFAEQAVAS